MIVLNWQRKERLRLDFALVLATFQLVGLGPLRPEFLVVLDRPVPEKQFGVAELARVALVRRHQVAQDGSAKVKGTGMGPHGVQSCAHRDLPELSHEGQHVTGGGSFREGDVRRVEGQLEGENWGGDHAAVLVGRRQVGNSDFAQTALGLAGLSDPNLQLL